MPPATEETLTERAATHGPYPEQAARAMEIMAALRQRLSGPAIPEFSSTQQHALLMIATKLSRIMVGNPNEPDHWRDIAGYATLVARELENIQ